MKIGILALQGAVLPHQEKLKSIGIESVEVRRAPQLAQIQGIILPGGESTTMIHLLHLNQLWDALREFAAKKPTWGICAGSILLARSVVHPRQESLDVMDISVTRNAYGRQNESFISALTPLTDWKEPGVEGVFIRAPRIDALGKNVTPLLAHESEVVMAREGNRLASTFHPELTDNDSVHRYFAKLCQGTA